MKATLDEAISQSVAEYLLELRRVGACLNEKYDDLEGNGQLRFAWSVDEEEGFLEYLSWKADDDLKSVDEPLIQVLDHWTNDRMCIPVEHLPFIFKKVLEKLGR